MHQVQLTNRDTMTLPPRGARSSSAKKDKKEKTAKATAQKVARGNNKPPPGADSEEQEKLGDSMDSMGSWGRTDLEQLFNSNKSPLITPGGRRKVHLVHQPAPSLVPPLSLGGSMSFEKPSSSRRRESSLTLATVPSSSDGSSNTSIGADPVPCEQEEGIPPPPPLALKKSPHTPSRKRTKSNQNGTAEKSTSKAKEQTSPKLRKGRKKSTSSSGEKKSSNGGRRHHKSKQSSPKASMTKHQAGVDTSDLLGNADWGTCNLEEESGICNRRRQSDSRSTNKSPRESRRKQSRTILVEDDPNNDHDHNRNKSMDDEFHHIANQRDDPTTKVEQKQQRSFRRIKYVPRPPCSPAVTKKKVVNTDTEGEQEQAEIPCEIVFPSPSKNQSPWKGSAGLSSPSPARLLLLKAAKTLSTPRRYLPPLFRAKDREEASLASLLDSAVDLAEERTRTEEEGQHANADLLNASAPDFYFKDLDAVDEDGRDALPPRPSSMRNMFSSCSSSVLTPVRLRRKKKKASHDA